ncbi:ESPR-type extended signal peptide-containing protein [Mitsuokella jalaludinii]|uniref:Adhesin yadA n=1 Tax=Mitsuokella jalaludinii TaxID=187979 RepID=A0A174AYP6_9FIRM|nr:ESPR-type extended signal peptide-containing protein [Mitsuokella jalaludinii]CUN93584.1 Adhesin yadA precursor [Mitsuokella jalaludinii]
MNRVYKVIYNRARNLYQVVSEITHSRGKARTVTARQRHERLTTSILIALLAMGTSLPVGWAADTTVADAKVDASNIGANLQPADGTTTVTDDEKKSNEEAWGTAIGLGAVAPADSRLVSGKTMYTELRSGITSANTIAAGNTVEQNMNALDQAIAAETTARTTADTELSKKIGALDANGNYLQKDASISSNLSTLDTQVKKNAEAIQTNTSKISTNTDAIAAETTARTTADTELSKKIGALDANGNYLQKNASISSNLSTLDTQIKNVIDAIGLDPDNTTTSYTSKLNKYFKVNPKATTDGTTTYDPDAAANGTNSVAIGPSAQAGEKTTDTTTSTTTVTGGTSSTAIGDRAKANGNQSVALGYGSQVLNTTDQSGKTTATISGSTAIGNGAKVNGATDATAVGTSAQVNETATGGIAFGKNAVTGEDKGTVTVGDVTADVAAVGGENSVALGTSAKASGNTALALGNGAQVNNYTTQSGTTVTKTVNSGSTAIGSGAVVTGANDAVAFGSGAKVEGTGTNADDSLAIGKSASVATAKDAMALGTSASVASGADNAIALGNTARANTTNATAIGYNATATGAGAVAIDENTSTSTEGGISIGSGTSVSGKSIVIGYATDNAGNAVKTESNNTDAVAIGNGAQANANDSISIGHQAGKDTAEGRASGYGSLIAIGTNAGNNVKGMQNVALGSGAGSNVKSSYNVAIGSNAGAGINYAADKDSNPQNGYNVSIGYEANYQSADANAKNIAESIAIGHSANAVSNATAMGYQTTASGDKSMAFGYNATAADTDSIAFGDNASAGGGNIAIGHGSQAPAVTSYSSSYLTNNTTLNGYISLGGKTTATSNDRILRRITNVADGSDDQDAVTVAQLKAAYTNLEGTITTTDTKISDTYTQEAIDTKIKNVESKITASKTKYFSINTSSDTLTANADSDGASTSGAADAMAIGPNASASSSKAVAIGNNVSASGKGSIALGTADNPATTGTVDVGKNTSANPHVTSAEGANSVAIGTSAIAQTDNSVALGTRASVYTSDVTDSTTGTTTKVGQQSIAIGYQAETRNSNAISIGSDAKAYSNGSTAIGHGAYAQGADAIVLGTSSRANGASSGILGKSNTINGSNTYAVGSENKVNGNWGAVTYSGLYGSKNTVNPVADTSGNTKHGMDSLSVTGNSNTISQGSYSDTVQNISILGNGNSVTGANTDEANAGTTANVTIIGGSNEVTGRDGAGSDYMGKTWNQLTRTSIIGYGNKVNQKEAATSLANTQILGNDVTATLGNSVYLGTGSSAKNANSPDTDTLVKAETDAANAVDTTGMTDDQKAKALSDAKAKARYAVKLAAMKANNGSTAGTEALNTDTTYDDGTNYTYAGSSPVGVVTVGSAGKERRIQNVAAGLVSASSTDAVNGSQLYALTRQIRFGGDNSSFGKTTAADDQNVVARGSNETIAITGGSDAVKSSTADGTTTYTVDTAKLTDNNIAVVADTDKNALHVQLASNLKDLNTAQLGSGSGESYKETIKLDGTGTTGGQMTLAGADGTVKTTLDTTGLTIANGPKFTSSGIDAGSQKINHVTAGTDDADAVNVKQLQSARTLLTQGTNTTLADTDADGHHTYTVNVDNLGVKANGTGTTVALANGINFKNGTNTTSAVDSNGNVTIDTKNLTLKANGTNTATVTMDNGINFKNGTNTTATVDTNGTVTISATHNKLDSASYTASNPSDSSNKTTLKLKDTDGNETTLNLTDTYTTVSKNTDHTITFKRNDGSTPVSISLDDLNGASKEALTTAAAKATTQVIAGANVSSVDDTNAGNTDGPHIYKVNVSNLGVKVADGQKKSVALSDGLVFGNGTNTTASVGDNGAITFNVSNDAIKTQAKDAINMKAGTNVNVDTETSKDGLSKTFTISATHNALKSATLTSKSNDVSTLTITDNDGKTASVDIKNTHLTVTKDYEAKTVTFTSNDGTTPATTLSLSDLGAASTADMNAAKAAASTEVKAGTNASLGTVETNQTDQHKIYTVNVDNLGLKQNGTAAGTVTLADGIDFADGTNTSATVSDGKVTFDLKRDVTGIDTVTANNSIQAGNVKVGKQGTDNKNYVTGLDNKNWTVGQTTYEAGRAATEDQLKSVSDKVASGFQVTDGTTSANIGADKKVTFTNGNYTTAKVTQATDGANVQYDINTAQINAGTNGTITAPTTDGVAMAANVAEAINSAAWNIKANDGTATAIKAGTTVGLKAGNNLTLSQSDTDFTYALNDELTGIKSLTTVAQDGVTTTLAASGVTIASSGTGNKSVSLTANGLNNGGKQITDVASGGDTDTNAANISDVKRLVQASASGTTETGFNVKGDDATSKKVKLGKQLNVVGGTTDSSSLSDDNIGVVTTADDEGNATLTVKLNKDITLDSVKAGNTTLNTNGVSNGKMNLTGNGMTITDTDPSKQVSVTTNGVSMGSQRIQNVADATQDTDAATLKQVKNARTVVARGSNVSSVTFAEGANNQMTYTVNVDNLSVKANKEAAKSVTLKNGLTFNDGTNTTASVGDNGEVKYDLNSTLTGLTSVTAGNSTLDTNGLTIKDGAATKVEITSGNVTMGGNVIHNVGAGIDPTDAVNKGQLDALQSQVSGGWNLSGTNSDGTAVTAKIGAGKTVTYADGTYTKSVITKDDTTGNATVKVDVTTGTFGSGTDDNAGTVTSTANGLATTQDVANAINSAAINVVADNTPNNKTEVKAGNTIHFAKDDNLTLNQDGTKFTYGLNKEISISKVTTSDATKGSTVQTAEGVTTTDAAGNTYIQNGQGITLTPSDKTKSPVKLTNTGLDNGGNVISGVAEGKQGTDAVNVSQLNKVQDQVGSGWQIAGNDGTKVANIGAGKKVAFKSSSKYLTTSTARSATGESDTGADVTYSLKTTALASGANGTVASIADANDGLVTAQNIATVLNSTYWSAAATASGSGSVSGNSTAASIKAGTQVTFTAGNNLSLTQDGTDFTYALLPDLTSMNTIRFGGTLNNGNWSGGLLIGKQAGSGANTAEGNYITGLSNTKWDRATISENSNMAATEGQLKQAIENITTSGSGTGGFGLQADTGNSIMQDLRKTIQIKGDGEGTQEGNIKTSNEGGTLRIRLNKALDLSKDGSVQVGTSKMSNGTIQLGEDADANKMIRMDSAKGTAAIGGVTVDGANKTVSGLANTTWDADKASQGGYKGSTKAATESQLAEAISTATSTASQDEAHIQSGTYAVGDKSAGATDDHNVSIKVVNGKGDQKGMVTISDVAKASEVGDVGTIAKDIQNKNGDATKPTSIVDAINNLNDKVGDKNYTQVKGKEIADGDSATTAIGKLNNRMNDIYTSSTQHSSVSTMDANLTLSEGKNASGGTDYKLGLNKENIDLGNVTINGNAGSIKADSFTAGDTVVNKDGVKVGDKSALTGDSLKVGGKTYVDDKGIDANGKAIGNVGDGKNDGDAVNVKQVNDLAARQGEAIGQNAAHINQLDRAVNRLDSRINRVGAGAAALAALHPGNYDPDDKVDFAAGFGNYRGASAAAVGMYYHPDETTTMSVGASFGGGENMVNAGITWKMGKDSGHMRTQAAAKAVPVQFVAAPTQTQQSSGQAEGTKMPQPVTAVTTTASGQQVPIVAAYLPSVDSSTRAENDELKELLARQTAILEKLADQKTAPAQAAAPVSGEDLFPDVPENHWAYDFVAKLAQAGALKDCRVEDPANNPMLTRNDFAQILYTALKNGATKNPALNKDGGLNHLANEFRAELKNVKR